MISFDEFAALGRTRRVVPVVERLVADDLTPIALFHQLCEGQTGTFLLESAADGVWSRWSIVGVQSDAVLTARDGDAIWSGREIAGLRREGPTLELLAEALEVLASEQDPELPPFHAGLVGFLGHDVVRHLHTLPEHTVDDLGLPEMSFLLPTRVAVLDHQQGELWLIANAVNWDASPQGIERAHADAIAAVEAMRARIEQPRRPLTAVPSNTTGQQVDRQRSSDDFQAVVAKAQEAIAAGEVSQVVISQRFDVPTAASAFDIYRALRLTNPSPYMYLLELDGFSIVGASPEALVTVHGDRVSTRPIAGSRPRGATVEEDHRLEAELLADDKERDEHMMLVDLGCDDLEPISDPGTVVVEESMTVHRYSHVMHLEAIISGRLRDDRTALDAVLACFPAGTLSGSPRARALELIEELEVSRRGVYGGVVGYFDFAGDSDVAIAIRTAVVRDGVAHVQSGAGIVAASVPAMEDAECGHKARAVITAIEKADSWR